MLDFLTFCDNSNRGFPYRNAERADAICYTHRVAMREYLLSLGCGVIRSCSSQSQGWPTAKAKIVP